MLDDINTIKARIKHLKEENAKAKSWGAAVGARHEEIVELENRLEALTQS